MTRTPNDTLSTLPHESVKARLASCVAFYREHFQPKYPGTHLNLPILRHTVESCFLDLGRMKAFHGIEYADAHKRAAFIMLWIKRTHPIQLHTHANMTESLIVVNELYGISLGLNHLSIRLERIPDHLFRNLIYTLHFRHIEPEVLAFSMYLLERGAKGDVLR